MRIPQHGDADAARYHALRSSIRVLLPYNRSLLTHMHTSALLAEDAASEDVLAKLHVGLLAGSNLTRTVPLDEFSWPLWVRRV